jgi:hypothetical protein
VEVRKLKPTNLILVNVVLRDRSQTHRIIADLKPRDRYRLGLQYIWHSPLSRLFLFSPFLLYPFSSARKEGGVLLPRGRNVR